MEQYHKSQTMTDKINKPVFLCVFFMLQQQLLMYFSVLFLSLLINQLKVEVKGKKYYMYLNVFRKSKC